MGNHRLGHHDIGNLGILWRQLHGPIALSYTGKTLPPAIVNYNSETNNNPTCSKECEVRCSVETDSICHEICSLIMTATAWSVKIKS